MPWQCYLIEPTAAAALTLRRFTWSDGAKCPTHPRSGHDAEHIVSMDYPWPPAADDRLSSEDYEQLNGTTIQVSPEDERWPRQCGCGYVFQPTDQYQASYNRLYGGRRGADWVMGCFGNIGPTLMPGAMWYVDPDQDNHWTNHWHRHLAENGRPGPDGRYLAVMLPRGTAWCIDGPAWNEAGFKPCPWTRTGDVPDISVTPSINCSGIYHGWVTNGFVTEDCEGRRFDVEGKPLR